MKSFQDSGLPSYSESVGSPLEYGSLPNNLASARTSLVESLLTTYVMPHLQASALCGLACSTLLLVPSNVATLRPPTSSSKDASLSTATFPGEKIIGFPDAENVTVVRLHEPENTMELWQQPAVLREVEQQLCTDLIRQGYRITSPHRGETFQSQPSPAAVQRQRSSSGWSSSGLPVLGDGEVRIGAETKEICLRVENQMGLYETRTGKALVIKVEVGG